MRKRAARREPVFMSALTMNPNDHEETRGAQRTCFYAVALDENKRNASVGHEKKQKSSKMRKSDKLDASVRSENKKKAIKKQENASKPRGKARKII